MKLHISIFPNIRLMLMTFLSSYVQQTATLLIIISYDSDLHILNGHYTFTVCKTLEFLFELRAELANSA